MEFRSDFQKLGTALQNSHPLFPPMCCATWTQNRLASISSCVTPTFKALQKSELLYILSPSEGISRATMHTLEYWHLLRLFQPKASAPSLQYWCECSLSESLLRCFLIWSDLAKGAKATLYGCSASIFCRQNKHMHGKKECVFPRPPLPVEFSFSLFHLVS